MKWSCILWMSGALAWSILGALPGTLNAESLPWEDKIPEKTDLVVEVNLPQILNTPALAALQDSGDIKRLREMIDVLRLKGTQSAYPVVAMCFFVADDAKLHLMTLEETPQAYAERLRVSYQNFKDGNVSVQQVQHNGISGVELKFTNLGPKKKTRSYEVAFLGNGTIAYGGHKDPLPWKFLNGRGNAVLTQSLAALPWNAQLSVRGAVLEPGKLGIDFLGAMRDVLSAWFVVEVQADDSVALRAEAQCTNAEKAPQLAATATMLSQLALMTIFGGDPNLCNQLCALLESSSDAAGLVTLKARLDAATIQKIDTFYAASETSLNQLLNPPATK